VAGLLVDLVEPGLVRFAGGWIERHRTGDEGELEIALPVSACCHGSNSEGTIPLTGKEVFLFP